MSKRLTYIFVLVLFLTGVVQVYAQNPDFVAAFEFAHQNKADSAKARIDKAMLDANVQKNAKAWYVRGFIYKLYYKTREAENRSSPARVEAVRSLRKSIQLDSTKQFVNDCKDNLKYLASRYHNDAAKALDTGNYEIPIYNFEQYRQIMNEIEPGQSTKAKEIEFTMALANVYTKLYVVNPKQRARFLDQAKGAYNQVLIVDPENTSTNFNMGLLFYNQAVYLIKGADYDIPLSTIDGLQENQVKLFKQSLPYMLKTIELDPLKEDAIRALSGIYFGLGDYDKSQHYMEILDKIKKEKKEKNKDK
ncbi:MAG: hypothetical protein ACHQRM_16850 [Bacteroidia bacterium]